MKLIENTFIGFSLADALGVPVEFRSRDILKQFPMDDMIGYGSYNLPPGTWSDDSSLSFCLADSLCDGYNLEDMAAKFVAWSDSKIWTARGEVFDIGNQTQISMSILNRILDGRSNVSFNLLGNNTDVYSNGNGSLMRIIPLLFCIKGKPLEEQFKIIWEVSALTHPHIRSAMACFIYLKLAEHILLGEPLEKAYSKMKKGVNAYFEANEFDEREVSLFDRILKSNIQELNEDDIKSSGYVLHTLEASIWCLLNSDSYLKSVFKAINLGADTDTTACVVGGIAGMYYGLDEVPKEWLEKLARIDDIKELSKRFEERYEIEGASVRFIKKIFNFRKK